MDAFPRAAVSIKMHERRGKNHQAYLWQYGWPGGSVVFDFRFGRGREGPKRFLGQFERVLQIDGYAAYQQVGGPKIVHAVCWAHARRKFIEVLKLHPEYRAAAQIVARMDDLFAIDAEARAAHMDHAARQRLWRERGSPLTGSHQTAHRSREQECIACQRTGQSSPLHAGALVEAPALPELSGTGTQQQPGGELHASGSRQTQKLDPHRQSTSRPETRCYSVHRRKLPPPKVASPRLPG